MKRTICKFWEDRQSYSSAATVVHSLIPRMGHARMERPVPWSASAPTRTLSQARPVASCLMPTTVALSPDSKLRLHIPSSSPESLYLSRARLEATQTDGHGPTNTRTRADSSRPARRPGRASCTAGRPLQRAWARVLRCWLIPQSKAHGLMVRPADL